VTRRIVLAGGPGSGKTTLLRALAARGHAIAEDSARSIIRARKSRSLSPRPPAQEFAECVLREDIRQYGEHGGATGLVFFERGIVDALCMLRDLGAMPESEVKAMLSAYRYHRQVFVFPPWEAIYVNDAERDQTFAEAERVHRDACDWYRCCGYETVDVPRAGVEARCAFVLEALDAAG